MPTRIDLQRYKKTYPFLRREPRIFYLSETESDLAGAVIETAEVSFAGGDQIIYSFTKTFSTAPKVTVSPLGLAADFNVYVAAVTTVSVVVRASSPNNESVHIHAIEVT